MRGLLKKIRRLRGRSIARLAIIFFSIAIAIAFDYLRDRSETLFGVEATYARIVTRGFRAAIPRYSALVEIRDSREPADVLQTNVCEQRRFLGRVLNALSKSHPSVVVLDKYFRAESCAPNPGGTQELQTAVAGLLDAGIPVVVGRYVGPSAPSDLVFPASATGLAVVQSDLTLEEDLRRVPLVWDESDCLGASAKNLSTLSLAAAVTHSPKLMKVDSRLAKFYRDGRSPFASLLPQSAYDEFSFSALELLCGKVAPPADWRNCSTPSPDILEQLRGRIVVIGEDSGGHDVHKTVAGALLGDKLQAMYIEAILDDALFAASWYADWIFGGIVVVAFAVIVFRFKTLGRIGWSLALIVFVYLFAAAVTKWGYYLDWQVGLILVGLLLGELATSADRLFNREPS